MSKTVKYKADPSILIMIEAQGYTNAKGQTGTIYRVGIMKQDATNYNNRSILEAKKGVKPSEIKDLNEWLLYRIDKYQPEILMLQGNPGKLALKAFKDKGVKVVQSDFVSSIIGFWHYR